MGGLALMQGLTETLEYEKKKLPQFLHCILSLWGDIAGCSVNQEKIEDVSLNGKSNTDLFLPLLWDCEIHAESAVHWIM